MDKEDIPLLRRTSASLTFLSTRSKKMFPSRFIVPKFLVLICLITLIFPILFWHRDTIKDISIKDISVPYTRPISRPIPQFIAEGHTPCLPPTTPDLIESAIHKRATCRKYSPFTTSRARIATVTAHFGPIDTHYQKALQTHLLHSLIHGTEVRLMCDPIIDSLWNKPAFILDLLMREMMKPARERLEWIMWADRDTMILDQCRPISSFLPPPSLWSSQSKDENKSNNTTAPEVNLLVTEDWNGLNNGVFILRVNSWAIDLFTAILALPYYLPDLSLPQTEQSAMEHVLRSPQFSSQTQLVPQHWFNAYNNRPIEDFASRENDTWWDGERWVRRGDFLVHFAGGLAKGRDIDGWTELLAGLGDVWEEGTVLRDVSGEIETFWKSLG